MTMSIVDNGVNVEALLGLGDAYATPEIARFRWQSEVSWTNGTHSRASVETFHQGSARSNGTRERSRSTSTTLCSSPPRTTR